MKKYWYCFTFALGEKDKGESGSFSFGDVIRGFDEQLVNMARINEARDIVLKKVDSWVA